MSELQNGLPERHQDLYPIAVIAMIIAIRVRQPGDTMRSTLDKVRKRLVYAAEQGELHRIGPPGAGLFDLPEVIAWARNKWPGKLLDLPAQQAIGVQSGIGVNDSVVTDIIPGDLSRCQEALQDAQGLIRQLQTDLQAASAEIDRLAPLAEKYEQNCEKNRQSARQPRKGSW